ncbi:FMN-binding protein [Desulfonatronovibrio magnus]|uniref:FMN-binding protein n=1 Tax=Desulfonatronovibrio magnus TaxID=698827 RepID=UPI000695DEE5|nr:FMN-binding protein [Desulfonatronovibrio magnus]
MKKDSTAYTVFFILSLTLFFGTGVSLVHHLTRDMLAENEVMHMNRTLTTAFSLDVTGDTPSHYLEAVETGLIKKEITHQGRQWNVYVRDDRGEPAIGFIFKGRGIWDVINGVIVLSSDLETLLSLQFLEQHETPGLGARIEEEWFKNEFKGLTIAWEKPRNQRIIIGTTPEPDPVNQVDSITGATQTSKALMDSLNRELDSFKRMVEDNPNILGDDHD